MKISKAEPPEEYTHEERNMMAGRPLAPYLTVYAPQLTSMMSISHRFAGMVLSGYAFLLASGELMNYIFILTILSVLLIDTYLI